MEKKPRNYSMPNIDRGKNIEGGKDVDEVMHRKRKVFIIIYRGKRNSVISKWGIVKGYKIKKMRKNDERQW